MFLLLLDEKMEEEREEEKDAACNLIYGNGLLYALKEYISTTIDGKVKIYIYKKKRLFGQQDTNIYKIHS